jgi:hypothetical protein
LAQFPPQARSSIAAPASHPCGASWAGCRPTSRLHPIPSRSASASHSPPACPPRRPRPSARHRRLPGRLRATRSAGALRARDAPVADAHRPALLLRRSLAATAPAASGGPSIRPWRCSGRQAPGARS